MAPTGIVSIADPPTQASMIPRVAGYLLRAGGDWREARAMAEMDRAHRVVEYLQRAPVPVGITGDTTYGGPIADPNSKAFFESLRNDSVFFSMLQAGALRKVPLNVRLGAITAGAKASIVAEGVSKPISKLTTSSLTMLAPQKATAIICITKEVVDSATAEAESVVAAELRAGVAAAVDAQFISAVKTGATVIAATASMGADLKAALLATNLAGPSGSARWIAGATAAKIAATLDVVRKTGPKGGELMGIPLVVSDSAAADELILLNGAGVIANASTIDLRQSEQAMLEMSDAPSSPPIAATVSIPLFQMDLRALKAECVFGVAPYVPAICSVITGIAWANA